MASKFVIIILTTMHSKTTADMVLASIPAILDLTTGVTLVNGIKPREEM